MARCFTAALLAAAGLGCAAGSFETRLLATVPENVSVIVPPVFSRDGAHVVYIGRSEQVDRIVRNGRAGPPHGVI